VAGFGALLYQITPKLDARLKAKYLYNPRHCLRARVMGWFSAIRHRFF